MGSIVFEISVIQRPIQRCISEDAAPEIASISEIEGPGNPSHQGCISEDATLNMASTFKTDGF